MSNDVAPGYKSRLKTAYVFYEGQLEDGTVFDGNLNAEEPMPIVVGAHEVILGFENALVDMKIGEKRTIAVPPDLGYGHRDDQAVQRSRLSLIKNGESLKEGMVFKMKSPVSLEPIQGKVLHINGDFVEIDFNHPLADENLIFTIELVGLA